MAQDWDIDPKTGDWIVNGGAPVETDSLRVPAYNRLKTRRLMWLYAPDKSFGSDFFRVRRRNSVDVSNDLEAIAYQALKPMIDDGRAVEVNSDLVVQGRGYAGLSTEIVDASGEVNKVVFNPLAT